MRKIKFDSNMPPEIVQRVEPYLPHLEVLIPLWMQVVYVDFKDVTTEDDGTIVVASAKSEPDYRRGSIRLSASMFVMNEYDFFETLVHEFVHLSLNQFSEYSRQCIEELLDTGEERQPRSVIIKNLHTEKAESATQDLAWSIAQMIWHKEVGAGR